MNKSLAPLIIGLAVVILLTMILISVQTPYMERGNYPDNDTKGSDKNKPTMQLSPYDTQNGSNANQVAPRKEIHISSEEVNDMYLQALNFYHNAQFKKSEELVRTALIFDPKNDKALMLYGRLLYQREKYDEAEAIYRRLAKMHPDSPMVYNNLGQVLAKQYRFNEAIEVLSTAHAKDPQSPIINLNLAGVHAVVGDRKKAIALFKKAYSTAGKQVLPAAMDPTLKSLQDDPEFVAFIKKAKAQAQKEKKDQPKLQLSPPPNSIR
jgi:Tfp pilus assembly protein PilF